MKKFYKRLLGTFLSFIMILTILPLGFVKVVAAASPASTEYTTGDIITFGSYPQTKVTDSSLITILNLLTLSADNTVTYDGSKYIKQTDWFKFESIQWRILSNTNGELFVMADKILASRAYNRDFTAITWETCTMRAWLNNDFYNTAFTPAQQAKIETSTVVNAANPLYGTSGGNNTNDKIFLLSYAEARNPAYGFSTGIGSDATRIAQGTDFAKSQGLYVDGENSFWWLRSPGQYSSYAVIVDTEGFFADFNVNFMSRGARPAFKINQSFFATISFDANGGMGGTSGLMTCGAALVAPTVERTGYTFAGWLPEVPATVPDTDTTYTAQWTAKVYTVGDIITFGSYPQTKVTDASLITFLNALTLSADNTVTYNSTKYKRVYFTQYTPSFISATPSAENSFQDDNGYFIETVYWFKFEPVQWRVLSNSSGELFVMAEKILESRIYSQVDAVITWETCTMRNWLNNEFYNTTFSSTEKAQINTSTLVNDDNPLFGTDGGNNTNDKLFLLSYADTINTSFGFSSVYAVNDAARWAQGTDFSKSSGLFVFNSNPWVGNSYWWLRSPGDTQAYAGVVNSGGRVNIGDGEGVHYTIIGARPAFRLNLNLDILTPVENSGCVINKGNGFIYGLKTGITKAEFESGYVQLAGNYRLEFTLYTGTLGTGTKVYVVNNATDEIVETHTIVIYGDVNGDGSIDSIDAGTAVDLENSAMPWDPAFEAAFIQAGDLNGDGNTDNIDAGIMVDAENYVVEIDQTTGLATII